MTIDEYIDQHTDAEDEYLHKLYRATNVHTIHGRMQSGHVQGRLLKMIVEMQRPQYILEVGTFSGYSAICMAEGLKQLGVKSEELGVNSEELGVSSEELGVSSEELGVSSEGLGVRSNDAQCGQEITPHSSLLTPHSHRLFTFEINDEMEDFTRRWIEESDVAEYIDFRIGDAIVEAPKLGVTFDMAFLDGDKRTYVETYEAILPLMREGGIILADNTLWDGHVIDPAYDHDAQTIGIRRFNDHVAKDTRVEKVILPLRDGLTMIRRL